MSDSHDAGEDADARTSPGRDPGADAEPEEYDPEADLPDPERDLVSIPEAPSVTPESEVAPELRRAFWKLVLVFNVALLSLSVGLMLVAFEGLWTVGGALVVVGALSFLRGYYRYRAVTGEEGAELWASDSGDAGEGGEGAPAESDEPADGAGSPGDGR